MGADYMMENADIVWRNKISGEPRTREVQQAEEKLRNLGIDVDRFVQVQTKATGGVELTPDEQTFLDNTTREATFNFVNEAIALPQSQNLSLIHISEPTRPY